MKRRVRSLLACAGLCLAVIPAQASERWIFPFVVDLERLDAFAGSGDRDALSRLVGRAGPEQNQIFQEIAADQERPPVTASEALAHVVDGSMDPKLGHAYQRLSPLLFGHVGIALHDKSPDGVMRPVID